MTQLIPPPELEPLIFDRTQDKLQAIRAAKMDMFAGKPTAPIYDTDYGSFSYKTMNRIVSWLNWINTVAQSFGYASSVNYTFPKYTNDSIIYSEDYTALTKGVANLKLNLGNIPSWKPISLANYATLENTNAMEWDLQKAFEYLVLVEASTKIYCGSATAICGDINIYIGG